MQYMDYTEHAGQEELQPRQIREISVRRAQFEEIFTNTSLAKCDEIVWALNEIVTACKNLIDNRFVIMKNKRVYFDRATASLYPIPGEGTMPYARGKLSDGYLCILNPKPENFDIDSLTMTIDGIKFHIATSREACMTYHRDSGNPYIVEDAIVNNRATINVEAFFAADYAANSRNDGTFHHTYNNSPSTTASSGTLLIIMIANLAGKNSGAITYTEALHSWLLHGLIPKGMKAKTERLYTQLMQGIALLDHYIDWETQDDTVTFKRNLFRTDVLNGTFRETVFNHCFDLVGTVDGILKGEIKYTGSLDSFRKQLLEADYRRADIEPYPDSVLTDINGGHWELAEVPEDDSISVQVPEWETWMASPPQLDIVQGGICAIDFGTKSTVVVCREGDGQARLLRVGTGDYRKAPKRADYENPTVLELRNITAFREAYTAREGRPFTRWEDLTVSHQAAAALLQQDAQSDTYYAVFSELKQWANERERRLALRDLTGTKLDLAPYLDLGEDDFDPIEVYAYYLGLYINNMRHGIYLDYILSFPVNYSLDVRERLLQSFRIGLRKSLPPAILDDEAVMSLFRVYAGASEPAAYAAAALQTLHLEPQDEGESVSYGVFDFGGGTTDFDFGTESIPQNRRRHKFEIHQFGRGGDPYLGGENILDCLAFEVYCQNIDAMRAQGITFALPHGCMAPAGTELLLLKEGKATQKAFMNRKRIAEELRPIWEQPDGWETKYTTAKIQPLLFPNATGEDKTRAELAISVEALQASIRTQVARGVDNFFQACEEAFEESEQMPQSIHILLAGNSCRASVVRELFEEHIKEATEQNPEIAPHFVLHMPLGMEIPDEGSEETENPQSSVSLDQERTGKTGVAFGLLRSRKGGKDVKFINDNLDITGETLFPYYLGSIDADGHFVIDIGKDVPYGYWIPFCPADEEDFEIYYTTEPKAVNGVLRAEDVHLASCRFDESETSDDDDVMVYLCKATPDTLLYAVGRDEDFQSGDAIDKKHTYTVTLK